jgi:hypothetical protein
VKGNAHFTGVAPADGTGALCPIRSVARSAPRSAPCAMRRNAPRTFVNEVKGVPKISLHERYQRTQRNLQMTELIPMERIANKIYLIRDMKVMLDRDLAELYNVETSQLKRAVRRNIDRFPGDFMFELKKTELEDWRCQFGTSKSDKMGLRYRPMAFTEQGVSMLSSVLRSPRAIINL